MPVSGLFWFRRLPKETSSLSPRQKPPGDTMVHLSRGFLTAAALLAISTLAAAADDWTAAKLRGRVLQLVDQQWQPLERGDTVPDGRVIRTTGGAQVQLIRGAETVDVGSNTQ